MTPITVVCRHCGLQSFEAVIEYDKKDDTDTHTYLRLICVACNNAMHFVVDLTPEFDRTINDVVFGKRS